MMNQDKLSNTVISFLGAPGGGKGTLANFCKKKLGFEVLSTGDLCRSVIASKSELGKKIKAVIDEGHLVSDGLIVEMVSGWLKERIQLGKPIILDGFPRTVNQARMFVDMLKKGTFSFSFKIFVLKVDSSVIIERLTSRKVCPGCKAIYSTLKGSSLCSEVDGICDRCHSSLVTRADDTKATIQERLKVYAQHEKELLDFYESEGVHIDLLNIEGGMSAKKVFDKFKDTQSV